MRRPQVVLFGDSITEQSFRSGGWGAALADSYSRKVDVLNRGYGGYNTRWALFLLHHIFPLGSPHPPAAATVFFGANDAALPGRTSERQYVPVDEYKLNLRSILLHIKKCSPDIFVVLITPPPVDEQGRKEYAISLYGEKAMKLPERTNEVTGVHAKICVELGDEMGIPSIDLWSKMQQIEGWQKKCLSDGLHLTETGNGIVYQQLQKIFNENWHDAASMPSDFPHHSLIDASHPEKAFIQHSPENAATVQQCPATDNGSASA
uniref:SGNH hydrolase-type esterase domain-containing protein n=1 Tax=Kalanchoe fedtschenkoi TaxID=63787 RepID=A0A7N0ZYM2_KALFE